MDLISTVALTNLPAAPLPATIPVPPVAPEAANTAYFSSLMAAAPAGEPAVVAAVSGTAPADVSATAAVTPLSTRGMTLGETVLQGMQNVSTDLQKSWSTVGQVLEGSTSLSVSDLLKVQMGLIQTSVQFEFMGKVVGRSTQNIDQLVKLQ